MSRRPNAVAAIEHGARPPCAARSRKRPGGSRPRSPPHVRSRAGIDPFALLESGGDGFAHVVRLAALRLRLEFFAVALLDGDAPGLVDELLRESDRERGP